MFCSKCGEELSEGVKFCPKCGTPAPAAEPFTSTTESVEAALEDIKPRKTGLLVGIGVAAVAIVALIVALIMNAFASPQKMLAKTINNGKDNIVDEYEVSFNSIKEAYSDVNGDMTFSIEATLGERTKSLLDTYGSAYGLDLSWINSANADMAVDVQDDQLGLDIKAGINGQEIGTLDAIIDAATETVYLTVPEAMSDFALAESGDFDAEEILDLLATYTESISTYADKYPDSDEIDKILSKYTTVIAKDLATADIEKSKEELSAGGVSAKYNRLAVDIDVKVACQLAIDLIDVFENDDDLKELIRPVIEQELELDEFSYRYDDFDDFWDSFVLELDEVKQEATDELLIIKDDEEENEEVGVLYLYLDKKMDCKGLAFEFAEELEETSIEFYAPENKSETGLLIKMTSDGDEIKLEGKSETKSNLANGSYTLSFDDEDILTAEVVDFNTKEFKEKRNYKGKVVFSLASGLTDLIGDSSVEMFTLADYALTMDTEGVAGTIDLDVLTGDESLVDIKMTYAMEDVADMAIPSKVYDMYSMSEEESMEMIKALDLSTIVNNLEKSGVPAEYYEKLSSLNDAIASGDELEIFYALDAMYDMSGDSYYDYDDDDYDYDDDYDAELSYLASLSYDEFAEYYRAYYDESGTDEEIQEMYDLFQEYYGQ